VAPSSCWQPTFRATHLFHWSLYLQACCIRLPPVLGTSILVGRDMAAGGTPQAILHLAGRRGLACAGGPQLASTGAHCSTSTRALPLSSAWARTRKLPGRDTGRLWQAIKLNIRRGGRCRIDRAGSTFSASYGARTTGAARRSSGDACRRRRRQANWQLPKACSPAKARQLRGRRRAGTRWRCGGASLPHGAPPVHFSHGAEDATGYSFSNALLGRRALRMACAYLCTGRAD